MYMYTSYVTRTIATHPLHVESWQVEHCCPHNCLWPMAVALSRKFWQHKKSKNDSSVSEQIRFAFLRIEDGKIEVPSEAADDSVVLIRVALLS